MPAYEYLMAVSVSSNNWAHIRSLPETERPPFKVTMRQWIWRPGAKEAEAREEELGIFPLFNELGREGWKLIESATTHSRVVEYSGIGDAHFYGHTGEIGEPVQSRYTFIREVAS
jgi:hypothetical protein